MGPKRLEGKYFVKDKKQELIQRAEALKRQGITPKLGILRVGENPDDLYYERAAMKRMEMLGLQVEAKNFPREILEDDLIKEVEAMNQDESIHGVLIFLPLPGHISEDRVKETLDPEKDVDGITFTNSAKLFLGREGLAPCTARGVVELLKYYDIPLEGAKVTIIGRSLVVGKPLSMLLVKENATVTITHSRTKDLPSQAKESDILVAALGKAKFVDETFVKDGMVVIDVGINQNEAGDMVGDVDYDKVSPVVFAISPVPGGVGSVTTTILAEQVIEACEKQNR